VSACVQKGLMTDRFSGFPMHLVCLVVEFSSIISASSDCVHNYFTRLFVI
jgi:hypothetical protein